MISQSSDYFLTDISEPYYVSKIKDFASLPNGWHCGEGIAPKPQVIDTSIVIANYAKNAMFPLEPIPGLNGEIQLIVFDYRSSSNKYLEITIDYDESIELTKYEKVNNCWEIVKELINASIDEVHEELILFRREIIRWLTTFVCSQRDILSRASAASQASPSETTRAEYQLFSNLAYQTPTPALLSATT